jgi:hypothetical protein
MDRLEKGQLEDRESGFPADFYFYDMKDDTMKMMTVTEEAWKDTLKTFREQDDVDSHIIQRYMCKQDDVNVQEV